MEPTPEGLPDREPQDRDAPASPIVTLPTFGEWLRNASRLSLSICPNCETPIGDGMCCMTYSEWHCWGCGAHLDSRVANPRTVYECETQWPDYKPSLGQPRHRPECACGGRAWFAYEDHPTLSLGYATENGDDAGASSSPTDESGRRGL